MKRVGLFGGSFDPIHLGHLITASFVRETRNLDRIIFIPCFISPHKTEFDYIDSIHRLEMVKIAIEGNSFFECSDFEIKREEVSYSIDTVKYFKTIYNEIDLIIGYDNLVVFDTWKNPDELIKLVNIIVLQRKTPPDKNIDKNRFFSLVNIIQTPIIEISSTIIRERIRNGNTVDYLVPEKVKNYIKENDLYTGRNSD